jgi:protein-S-isoprenylcysteine O-methyltransferase Ste14
MVSVFNTVMNAGNVVMSLWPLMSNAPRAGENLWASAAPGGATMGSVTRTVGMGMFVLGSLVETWAEVQRKRFKDDKRNEGKVFMGGLFGLARHVNYGGYFLWRTGFALFAGGLPWAGVIGLYFMLYFLYMGIPALDEYCSARVCCSHSCPWTARLLTSVFSSSTVNNGLRSRSVCHTSCYLGLCRTPKGGWTARTLLGKWKGTETRLEMKAVFKKVCLGNEGINDVLHERSICSKTFFVTIFFKLL